MIDVIIIIISLFQFILLLSFLTYAFLFLFFFITTHRLYIKNCSISYVLIFLLYIDKIKYLILKSFTNRHNSFNKFEYYFIIFYSSAKYVHCLFVYIIHDQNTEHYHLHPGSIKSSECNTGLWRAVLKACALDSAFVFIFVFPSVA